MSKKDIILDKLAKQLMSNIDPKAVTKDIVDGLIAKINKFGSRTFYICLDAPADGKGRAKFNSQFCSSYQNVIKYYEIKDDVFGIIDLFSVSGVVGKSLIDINSLMKCPDSKYLRFEHHCNNLRKKLLLMMFQHAQEMLTINTNN